MTCMLTVLQGYTSFLAGSPLLLRCCLIILVVLSRGTLTRGVWLETVHRQTVGLAQTRSSDKEELLPGEPQEMIICFLFNHFLCLPFLFPSSISSFCTIQHRLKNAALCKTGGVFGLFLFLSMSFPLLCWSWCLAVLCAMSETASNHKDPAVHVNFIKVLADWHFLTCNRGKLCSRWSFIYSFCPLHINQYSFLCTLNIFKTSCALGGGKLEANWCRSCLVWIFR